MGQIGSPLALICGYRKTPRSRPRALRLSYLRPSSVTRSMPKPMKLSSNTGQARMAFAKGLRRRQAGE